MEEIKKAYRDLYLDMVSRIKFDDIYLLTDKQIIK